MTDKKPTREEKKKLRKEEKQRKEVEKIKKKELKPSKKRKKIIKIDKVFMAVALTVVIATLVANGYKSTTAVAPDMTYLQFIERAEKGEIESAVVVRTKDYFTVQDNQGDNYNVVNPAHDEARLDIVKYGIDLRVAKKEVFDVVIEILATLPLTALMIAIAWNISKSFVFGTSAMFRILKSEEIVKFEDVAGMSESKEEVMFAVDQINKRMHLAEMGAIPTKGIILEGPPGTGKTMLAKAIAGEADVPFISTSGSDFIEMFVGLGASRVRALWELAEVNAPCVIFIDEIDAVGRSRTTGGDAGSTESNQTLNALLQKMDGMGTQSGIFVVAATNRIKDLDPALLRPGRFDKQLYIGPPKTKKDRNEVIGVHLKNKKVDGEFTVDKISSLMFGMTGAEIAQVINESVLISSRDNRDGVISVADVDEASMKTRASGVATKHSSDEDMKIVAIHEAGHALVSTLLGNKVAKVSIMPYSSGIGGMTIEDTDKIEDRKLKTRSELLDDIKVLLAGRSAELLVNGDVTTGSSNDLERASLIAYNMVNSLGMEENVLMNIDVINSTGTRLVSSNLGHQEYIKKANSILLDAERDVQRIIKNNRDKLDRLIDRLIEEETIINYEIE